MKPLLLSLLLSITMEATASSSPLLVVLDVGEGQALLLQDGRHGILVDTGHPGMSRHLLHRLSALGVEQLDYLILTHLHPDHAGGYFRLREQFPDTPLLYTGHPLSSHVRPDLVRWVNQAVMADRHRRKFLAGDTIRWKGLTLEALWPESFSGANLNHHSLVLLLRYQELKLLFMGDAGSAAEKELLARGKLPGAVDLLVAGHHGAADATSEPFLAVVKPEIAVISVNRDNIRGYPGADVVKRLKSAGARLLRTDRDGELRFRLRCKEAAIEGDRGERCSIQLESGGASVPGQ